MVSQKQSVLVVGDEKDPTIKYFASKLQERIARLRLNIFFINQQEISKNKAIIDHDAWYFENYTIEHESIVGVWNRFNGIKSNRNENKTTHRFLHLLDWRYKNVINRPYACMSNFAKMHQLTQIKSTHIKKPESFMVFNMDSKAEVLQSKMKGKKWVCKSASGRRSIVESFEFIESRSRGFIYEPVLIQEYIQGSNIRVHVIENRVFTVKITSKKIDYRYDQTTKMETYHLPDNIEKECIAYAKAMHLVFAGIDLIKQGDHYYILEVNTAPGYHAFEQAGDEISHALLDYFISVNNFEK